MQMIKVGDKVKVIKKVTEEDGRHFVWHDSMDKYIGKCFVVDFITNVCVYNSSYPFGFPHSSLKVVEKKLDNDGNLMK